MAYRGEDLDLRVPQQRAREGYASDYALNGTRPRQPLTAGVREPLVIDDTVMACCNHAYDIAQAHGASEVRLEHLVHALTRVEAAADILEERGIREAHLRRESAAVIAAEIPVGLAHSQSAPRASVEFEDVLRRASQQAAANGVGRGASVHDLLWVLLNYNRDIPAIALLLRHAAGWQSWDWPNRPKQREDAPPRRDVARARPAERVVERVVERRPSRPVPAYDPPETIERVVERVAPLVAPVDTGPINGRLDQMDQAIRSLQAEMSADRRALTELLRDLQRDVQSRGSGSGDIGVMMDQLRGIETTVEDRLGNLSRTASALTERLQEVERSISGSAQEGARHWTAMGERLKAIDKVVATNSNSGLGDLVTDQLVTITDQVRQATQRLEALERAHEQRQADGQRGLAMLTDRIKALDEAVAAGRRESQVAQAAQSPGQIQSLLAERFQAVKGQMDQQRLDLTSAMAQVVEPLVHRVAALEGAADRRHAEATQVLSQAIQPILQRLATIEPALQANAQRIEPPVQAIAARVAGIDSALREGEDIAKADRAEVHDALVKLGTNQQTLAGNLDQWRQDSIGDLSVISNRLEALERDTARPIELLQQLQLDMQGVQQLALADYEQGRRGFMHWLFGTDDVFARSWRDETAVVRARLKQAKSNTGIR